MTKGQKFVAAALAAGLVFPAGAFAQDRFDDGRNGPPRHERHFGGDGWRGHGGNHHGAHRGWRGGPRLWDIAGKLSAAEVALGITAEQEPAWRDFTAAAIAFAQAGRGDLPPPPFGEEADSTDDAGPVEDAGATSPQAEVGQPGNAKLDELRGVRMLQRVMDRRIAQGQAAERVKSALDGLSGVLTPEQVRTADRLLAELPRPGRGPRHGFGPDRGPMPPRGPEGSDSRRGDTPHPPRGDEPAPAPQP